MHRNERYKSHPGHGVSEYLLTVMAIQRDLESEKAAKQTALTNYKALPTKKCKLYDFHVPIHSLTPLLAQQEDKLRASEAAIVGVRRRVEALRDKQDQLSLEKASRALEYAVSFPDEWQTFSDANCPVELCRWIPTFDWGSCFSGS